MPNGVVQRLQLKRVDQIRVQGFGGVVESVRVFAALLHLGSGDPWIARVVEWGEPYGILGRDAMNRWRIVLDGPAKRASIG